MILLKMLDDKLHADSVVPGMYDVITAPEITGLIAHEAFGHGVEMDMFVKERALGQRVCGQKSGFRHHFHEGWSGQRSGSQQLSLRR